MTGICFSARDVKRWADFSGDRNPIHFDPETARRLIGDDGPFVQGMLAMLPLKQAFADSLTRANEGGTWRWHAQLRRPMPIAAHYRLVSRNQANGGERYQLQSATSNDCFITAIAAPQADISQREGRGKFLLASPENADLTGGEWTFPFPDIRLNWIGLDALLFESYVRGHLPEFLLSQGLNATNESLSTQTELLMQISHTVIAERWALDCADTRQYGPFTYDIAVVSSTSTGRTHYATVQLSLFGNNRLFMNQELSLMLAHPAPMPTPEFGNRHDYVSPP